MLQNQQNQSASTTNGRQLKKSEAWARIRVVQLDPETGKAAVDEDGNTITHWFTQDVPFDGKNPASKGLIALAKEDPSRQFLCQMTINVVDEEAQANQEPLLDF